MFQLETNKNYAVGVNWGAIRQRFMFMKTGEVDLDLTCAAFDKDNRFYDIIYFGNIDSRDKAIIHSGDDQAGDLDGDDELDNETIEFNLAKLDTDVSLLIFFLNSYNKKVFQQLPHAIIRFFERNDEGELNIYSEDLTDGQFKGSLSMILGEVFKLDQKWIFKPVGKPIYEQDLKRTLLSLGQYVVERNDLIHNEA